ncbi:MAG: serine/threonine protein kinase [Planctomycetes bacterium]|nr:serine/threonine protein kinase [Planctomycetota bacterium]
MRPSRREAKDVAVRRLGEEARSRLEALRRLEVWLSEEACEREVFREASREETGPASSPVLGEVPGAAARAAAEPADMAAGDADLAAEPEGLPEEPTVAGRGLPAKLAAETYCAFSRRGADAEREALDLTATSVLEPAGEGGSPTVRRLDVDEGFWRDFEEPSRRVVGERFALVELLARGGTSRIFRAVDRRSGRSVALKVIPPPLSEAAERSVELLGLLRHPGIPRVEASGAAGEGGLYLVTPLLGGVTLRRLAAACGEARGPLLLAYRSACDAVAHAHGRKVVHGDLKPLNLQVEEDGRAVVLDWDLARREGRPPERPERTARPEKPERSEGSEQAERPAQPERVLGTPLYMAPEQLRGHPSSSRTDVYALGVVLYELLTGRNPAGSGENLEEVIYRACKEAPPPPSVLVAEVPAALDEIALRCLAKDPKIRFASAAEVLEAVEGAGW